MQRPPPRLLYIGNHAGHFVSHRLPIALRARDAGFDVHIATPSGQEVAEIEKTGIPYYSIPLSRQGQNPVEELRTIFTLITLFRQVQPDIVHNFTIKPVIYGGIVARLTRVPIVVNSITGLGAVFSDQRLKMRVLRRIVKIAYRVALQHPHSRLIFQNPDDQTVFAQSNILPNTQMQVVKGSGVDVSEFVPQPFPSGPVVVVMASRMMWEKGVGEYIEAVRNLKAEGVQARFLLLGDSDIQHHSMIPREQLQQWNDEGVVEWQGYRSDMPNVFAGAHIIVLPSYYREGIPKVLIEAAAAGRPIVTTDTPGCREIVHNHENGLLIPKRDIPALTAAMRCLIEDAALREQMGRRGREIVLDGFTIEKIASDIIAVYEEFLHV